jgi:ABC-2 type transport system permease protein
MLAAQSGIWSLNMVGWERNSGTLQLLVASPSSPSLVFASRGSYMIADGLVSALGALAVAGPLFGLPLPWPRVLLVLPLTALVGLAAYSFGTFLGGVVLRHRQINNVVAVGSILAVMTLAGVNVPVQFYPDPVQWLTWVLPVAHGLQAIRETLAGSSAGTVATHAAGEAAVWFFWLVSGLVTFNRMATKGRSDGSIEFGA